MPQLGMSELCFPAPPTTTTLMFAADSVIGTRSSSASRCIHGAQARKRERALQLRATGKRAWLNR